MPEAFKNLINPGTVREIGAQLTRAWPAFDRKRFERLALNTLETLEFKARAQHVCNALEATLPDEFERRSAHAAARSRPTRRPTPV